jgi:hypothetical protein
VPPPLRGLGITFIITGLMGIGFQSFGGMMTGGEDAAPVEETTAEVPVQKENATAEAKVFLTRDDDTISQDDRTNSGTTVKNNVRLSSAGEENKIEKELADKEKEVSYNDALNK